MPYRFWRLLDSCLAATVTVTEKHGSVQLKTLANPFHIGLAECEQHRWLEWAEWMVRQYHRSSSAVEGRNGRLSQLYHN